MGRSLGSCDIRQLEDFEARLRQLPDRAVFFEACARELAARLLRKAIKRTPVGVYPPRTGKKGGTLRRGWTAGKDVKTYVNSLAIRRRGNTYIIEVANPVEYAPYVEFGHRTRGGTGWVEGKFMLTISEQEIETASFSILSQKLDKMLRELVENG